MRKAITWVLAVAFLALLAVSTSHSSAAAGRVPAVAVQTPEPSGPGTAVKEWEQRAQDQIDAWAADAKETINAEQDRLKADMQQRLKQEADNAAQSLGERITLELHKLVDQVCGGASASLILGVAGLALALRARKPGA